MFGKKSSGRRVANRASVSTTEHRKASGSSAHHRAEPSATDGTVGRKGALRRNTPLALAVTAALAAVLIPQASADEVNAGTAVGNSFSVPDSPEIDRIGLVERYMGDSGSDAQHQSNRDQSQSRPDRDKGGPKGKGEVHEGNGKEAAGGGDNQQQSRDKESSSAKDSKESTELAAPLEKLKPTSSFGPRISPITGAPSEFHTGQDYAGTCGTPVKSAADGKITEAGWHPYGGGKRITVSHGDGLKTTYNHMSSMGVSVGETVDKGETIGQVGTTGASTGCHLHFEVVVDGEKVNPLKWL